MVFKICRVGRYGVRFDHKTFPEIHHDNIIIWTQSGVHIKENASPLTKIPQDLPMKVCVRLLPCLHLLEILPMHQTSGPCSVLGISHEKHACVPHHREQSVSDHIYFQICENSVCLLLMLLCHIYHNDWHLLTVSKLSIVMRKPVWCHMWTTKARINLCIRRVWSAPLLFTA